MTDSRVHRWIASASRRLRALWTSGEAACPHGEADHVDLLERFARCRAEIRSRVFDANEMTEAEALAVGDRLREIVEQSEKHVEETRKAIVGLTGSSASPAVATAISEQSALTSRFVDGLLREVEKQDATLTEAAAQSARIAAAAERIEGVTHFAKMLSLNTMVEAARLTDGSSFSVIAREMKGLSDGIRRANEEITELADRLNDNFDRIHLQTDTIRVQSETFSHDLEEHMRAVSAASEGLTSVLGAIVEQGDERDELLIQSLHRALGHLQFQDPVAQRLLRIDGLLSELQDEIAERLGLSDVVEKLPAAQEELGGGKDASTLEAGDVLLF